MSRKRSFVGHTQYLPNNRLCNANVNCILEDIGISGITTERPRLADALAYLRVDDLFIVWKLDRLGHSMRYLRDLIVIIDARKTGFCFITESIDTITSTGRLVFHISGALRQFECAPIYERTQAELNAARAHGRRGDWLKTVTPARLTQVRELIAHGLTVREAAARIKVGKLTLYIALAAYRLIT